MKLAKFVIIILTIMSCFMTFSIYNSAKATETNAGGFVSSSNSTRSSNEEVQTQVMTSVGEVTSGQNAGFGLQESLNTIIIAVGVIIILLSIAILVRLRQY